jgi:malonyl-CoA O-methyltransferase
MRVAAAFDRAADYDGHARVQHRVARALADRILALDLPQSPRVLELGCGTGALGAALIPSLPGAEYWMTDIAPSMIERARARFANQADVRFAVMDGAAPTLDGPFDLICSSMAMQWFADLPLAIARLRRLLPRKGALAFTTLSAGTFAEWREAHGERMPGTPEYPTAEALHSLGLDVSIRIETERYETARGFLAALKKIGAGTPQPGYTPLRPDTLRRVMARFEARGAIARYVVATCIAGPMTLSP